MGTPRVIAGRYEVVREVARGGMAVVYEAVHVVSRRRVALKVLFDDAYADDVSRARFLREVSAPARIGHEGLVQVFDAGFDDDTGAPFVAMELLEGHTLRDEMARGPLPLARTLSLFERLLAPVAAAHASNIVHRDLKPENVFLASAGGRELVKVLDFGLARVVDERAETETRTGVAMGTPHYMAPEQAVSARDVTPAADVWALGVMLYEALCGTPPFTGPTPSAIVVEAVTQPHRRLRDRVPDVSPALSTLVDRCLEKEAAQRVSDAGSMLRELRAVAASAGAPSPPAAVMQTSVPPTSALNAFAAPTGSTVDVTPTPFASPLITPPPSAVSSPASGGAPPEGGSGKVLGLAVGAGLGLLLVAFVAVVGGAVYWLTHRDGDASAAQSLDGELRVGDQQLSSGELADRYEFDWPQGARVHLELSSQEFDPYLIARPPTGRQLDNDDVAQGQTNAGLDFAANPGGRWVVVVTSYRPGEAGRYHLVVSSTP